MEYYLFCFRFLLARAEGNLYGRLTLEELAILAQEVARGLGETRMGYGPRSTIHQAIIKTTIIIITRPGVQQCQAQGLVFCP